MRLKRFNAEKEYKKLERFSNRSVTFNIKVRTIILSVFILVVSIILFTYASFSATTKVNVMHAKVGNLYQNDYAIVAYIDGVRTDTVPPKRDGYVVTNVTCDNNATGEWDNTRWAIIIENATIATTTCSVYFVTPNDSIDNEVAEPELYNGRENKAGLIPVKYDNGDTVVADPENKNDDWYSYEDHEWANAVLVSNYSDYYDQYGHLIDSQIGETIEEENILQYYVWIPRYRYKLFNSVAGAATPEQMIDIKFETNERSKSEGTSDGEWLTHPAFTFGTTELNGFWVGKFEPSIVNTSGTNIINTTTNSIGCSNETCASADRLRILPNNISLTNNNISNEFYITRSIENSSIYNLSSNIIDSHMMMNMEWGAVAYLTQSEYGVYKTDGTCNNSNQATTNGCEIFINNINVGYGNDSNHDVSWQWGPTVTGCSASGANTGVSNTHNQTNPTCASNYTWESNGVLASTTGNIYGVYDMSGGTWEYMMANQSSVSNTYTWFPKSSGFSSAPDSKYYDRYLASTYTATETTEAQDQARGLLGDATREIMKTYSNTSGGWNGDYAYFVSVTNPWFTRGGRAIDGASAGVFAFNRSSGGSGTGLSFRVVLSAQ